MIGKKIRIGIDVTCLIIYNQATGIERVVSETNRNLVKIMDPDLYEIVPFCTVPDMQKRESIHPYLASDPVLAKPLMDFRECDILFFGSININLPLMEIVRFKKSNNIRILTLIHDIIPLKNPDWFRSVRKGSQGSFDVDGKGFFQIYLQTAFALSDRVITISQHVKNDIQALGWKIRAEIDVIPLGSFDTKRIEKVETTAGIRTVYVSTVMPRKGHEELLQAIEILWDKGVDISLNIIGANAGFQLDFIDKIVRHPERGKRLFWEERLLDSEVEEIYARSDLAFATSYDEGFGLVIEEALSKGLKVLARDIPVFRERTYPNLHYFSGGAKELSERILETAKLPTIEMPVNTIRTMNSFSDDVAKILSLL